MLVFEPWDEENLQIGDVVKVSMGGKAEPSVRLIQSNKDGDGDYIAPNLTWPDACDMHFDPRAWSTVLVCRCDLVQTILELSYEDK